MAFFIMSFKPVYADQILDGLKTCEIRTCFTRLSRGDIVIVYASSPSKTIKGYIVVDKTYCPIEYRELKNLRKEHDCRIPEDNWRFVEKHYRGSSNLLFFTISYRKRFYREVKLEEIKRLIPSFKPPLSYEETSREVFNKIISLTVRSI
jgi:predicted transcriptional regulator